MQLDAFEAACRASVSCICCHQAGHHIKSRQMQACCECRDVAVQTVLHCSARNGLELRTANVHAGITKVGFPEYVAASWAGMLPGTFAYVYLGSLGKVAADAADTGAAGGFDGIKLALYGEAATAQNLQ
jgi:hypothetical protein